MSASGNESFSLLAVDLVTGGRIVGGDTEAWYETASAIKSPLGWVALEKCEQNGYDPSLSYLEVSLDDHGSNGSGILKRLAEPVKHLIQDDRTVDGTAVASLASLLELSITESDCVATNALIDYVGGKDEVNDAFDRLGLEFELTTDRLDFPGVDHAAVPFQVGRTTVGALADYYAHLETFAGESGVPKGWLDTYLSYHRRVKYAYLLGHDQVDVPPAIRWTHKTGTVVDKAAPVYAAIVDAGRLELAGRAYAVAAALTTQKAYTADLEAEARDRFARLSISALGIGEHLVKAA